MTDSRGAGTAADPLQAHMEATELLAQLIAEDDDERYMLAFQSLANVVDRLVTHPREQSAAHARSLLAQSAEPHLARGRTGPRMAVATTPTPAADSLLSDPVFLKNARKMIANPDRIVGGVPTSDFPDCVAVGSNTGWCCTGTLVAPNVVVTAGHCVAPGCCRRVFVGEDVATPGQGRVIAVQHTERHPRYQPPDPTHDLTVLILAEPVDVPPRGLGDAAVLQSAFSVRLAGYGNTDVWSSGGYGRRRMVDVPMASPNPQYGADPASEFVAGAPFLDRDSCNGDSGGPAYVQADGTWYLAGATSRATDSAFRPCGDGGIYTRLDVYADWMRSVPGGLWG